MARILIAMSGGVDSAVAAALLKREGHDVCGAVMSFGSACPAGSDPVGDARRVGRELSIDVLELDAASSFERQVVEPFCDSYARGLTPNPCVLCNRRLKFGLLGEYARQHGYGLIATGHYARKGRRTPGGALHIRRASDRGCDQSYFLYSLTQEQIESAEFPVGEMGRKEVASLAGSLSLCVRDKPGSQDVCFLGGGEYGTFLSERRPELLKPGPIVLAGGEQIGTHRGFAFYTVGQRTGLGVAAGRRMYVLATRPDTNTVVVGDRSQACMSRVGLCGMAWPGGQAPQGAIRARVSVRYRQEPAPARITALESGRAAVDFDEAQFPSAPGQSAVIYDGEFVIGGGVISDTDLNKRHGAPPATPEMP